MYNYFFLNVFSSSEQLYYLIVQTEWEQPGEVHSSSQMLSSTLALLTIARVAKLPVQACVNPFQLYQNIHLICLRKDSSKTLESLFLEFIVQRGACLICASRWMSVLGRFFKNIRTNEQDIFCIANINGIIINCQSFFFFFATLIMEGTALCCFPPFPASTFLKFWTGNTKQPWHIKAC